MIDPKSGEAVKIVSARDLWWQLLNARAETGEPYMINIDRCNESLPQEQKDLGLKINQSNLETITPIYKKDILKLINKINATFLIIEDLKKSEIQYNNFTKNYKSLHIKVRKIEKKNFKK